MTTHVRVMYVLDKHVHTLNFLTISIDRSNFSEYVRVWRFILKKIMLFCYEPNISITMLSPHLVSTTILTLEKHPSCNGISLVKLL